MDLSLYTDEAQLQTKKSGKKAAKGGKKQKKSKGPHLGDSESESEEDSDDDLRAGPSPPLKGPSRAERLLNRSKGPAAGGSGTSNQSATPSTSKKRGTPAQPVKKAEAKKPATPAAAPAKPVVSPATPSTSGTQPRTTKSRGNILQKSKIICNHFIFFFRLKCSIYQYFKNYKILLNNDDKSFRYFLNLTVISKQNKSF